MEDRSRLAFGWRRLGEEFDEDVEGNLHAEIREDQYL